MARRLISHMLSSVNRFSFRGVVQQTWFQLNLSASVIKKQSTILQNQRDFATRDENHSSSPKTLRNALFEHKQQGRWREALETFAEMKRMRLTLSPADYTAAIAVCGKHGRVEHALELHADMKVRGLRPDVRSYSALISACGKGMR